MRQKKSQNQAIKLNHKQLLFIGFEWLNRVIRGQSPSSELAEPSGFLQFRDLLVKSIL
jgi:hypothetical protein